MSEAVAEKRVQVTQDEALEGGAMPAQGIRVGRALLTPVGLVMPDDLERWWLTALRGHTAT